MVIERPAVHRRVSGSAEAQPSGDQTTDCLRRRMKLDASFDALAGDATGAQRTCQDRAGITAHILR